jgi:hypothetical protein
MQHHQTKKDRYKESVSINIQNGFYLSSCFFRSSDKPPLKKCLLERTLCFPQIPTCVVLLNLAKPTESDPTLSGAIFPGAHVFPQIADKKGQPFGIALLSICGSPASL